MIPRQMIITPPWVGGGRGARFTLSTEDSQEVRREAGASPDEVNKMKGID